MSSPLPPTPRSSTDRAAALNAAVRAGSNPAGGTLAIGLRVRLAWPRHIYHGEKPTRLHEWIRGCLVVGRQYAILEDCDCPPYLTGNCGEVVHISPCKAYPEAWPIGAYCEYLRPADLLEPRRRECLPPAISCIVRWDSYVGADGSVKPLPGHLVNSQSVDDPAGSLVLVNGTPVEVAPLIERVAVAGDLL